MVTPAFRYKLSRVIKNLNNPIYAIPPWPELKRQVLKKLKER